MNATAWVAVITAAGTTIGALTALVIAINKLFNSVPIHIVQRIPPIADSGPAPAYKADTTPS